MQLVKDIHYSPKKTMNLAYTNSYINYIFSMIKTIITISQIIVALTLLHSTYLQVKYALCAPAKKQTCQNMPAE